MTDVIHIAAALIRNKSGRALLVRKRGTLAFMQAGGKIRAGESPRVALARELAEELGVHPLPAANYLGRFKAPAANEPDCTVIAELYDILLEQLVTPQNEIEEVRWIDPRDTAHLLLAPLTRRHVLPLMTLAKRP